MKQKLFLTLTLFGLISINPLFAECIDHAKEILKNDIRLAAKIFENRNIPLLKGLAVLNQNFKFSSLDGLAERLSLMPGINASKEIIKEDILEKTYFNVMEAYKKNGLEGLSSVLKEINPEYTLRTGFYSITEPEPGSNYGRMLEKYQAEKYLRLDNENILIQVNNKDLVLLKRGQVIKNVKVVIENTINALFDNFELYSKDMVGILGRFPNNVSSESFSAFGLHMIEYVKKIPGYTKLTNEKLLALSLNTSSPTQNMYAKILLNMLTNKAKDENIVVEVHDILKHRINSLKTMAKRNWRLMIALAAGGYVLKQLLGDDFIDVAIEDIINDTGINTNADQMKTKLKPLFELTDPNAMLSGIKSLGSCSHELEILMRMMH